MFDVKKTTKVVGDVFEQVDKAFDQVNAEMDKMFDSDFFKSVKQSAEAILAHAGPFPSFPPINVYIEKYGVNPETFLPEDTFEYVIQLALSGYKAGDVEVNVHDHNGATKTLVIESKGLNDKRENIKWYQRGIAGRAFKVSFTLINTVKVRSAALTDGLLTIKLAIVKPEVKSNVENIPLNKG